MLSGLDASLIISLLFLSSPQPRSLDSPTLQKLRDRSCLPKLSLTTPAEEPTSIRLGSTGSFFPLLARSPSFRADFFFLFRSSYNQILFRPRVLQDVLTVDTSTTFLGEKVRSFPSTDAISFLHSSSSSSSSLRLSGLTPYLHLSVRDGETFVSSHPPHLSRRSRADSFFFRRHPEGEKLFASAAGKCSIAQFVSIPLFLWKLET